MKKKIDTLLKVILSLLLVMPIFGALGIFPKPTPDMYSSERAYNFIMMLMDAKYITGLMSLVFLVAIICLWTKREALAAILISPITLNIVGFHAFIDNGLLTAGAVMGNILLLINIYFMWKHRSSYKTLFRL